MTNHRQPKKEEAGVKINRDIRASEVRLIDPDGEQAGIVALLLNGATMLVGYYSSKLFRIKAKRSVSISIESGIQNGTWAMAIAIVLLENAQYAIAPAVYSLIMFLTGGVLIYWGINKAKQTA